MNPAAGVSFHWRPFLERFSWDLTVRTRPPRPFPREQQVSGWLGYAGASSKKLPALETRLGNQLPPSYRAFLLTSNGWW